MLTTNRDGLLKELKILHSFSRTKRDLLSLAAVRFQNKFDPKTEFKFLPDLLKLEHLKGWESGNWKPEWGRTGMNSEYSRTLMLTFLVPKKQHLLSCLMV